MTLIAMTFNYSLLLQFMTRKKKILTTLLLKTDQNLTYSGNPSLQASSLNFIS